MLFRNYDFFPEFNNCHPNPCINGTCEDLNSIYICSCFDGYKGTNCDGKHSSCPCLFWRFHIYVFIIIMDV